MQPTLNDLETLARVAGGILYAGYGQRHQVDHKGVIDLVTEVDRRSEAYLLGEIRSRFPGHAIVSEESGSLAGADGQRWHVDPLDGTINYAHGVPVFSVSLAYEENGEVRLGVVYDPMRDECFAAEKGRGAHLNGQPLQAASVEDLNQCLMATGFSYGIRTAADNNLGHYNRFALRTQGVRRLGSAALDMCYVAAGRFDGYWELVVSSWDVAAGILIAREAGARVTDVRGGAPDLSARLSVLAANPVLHARMLEVLWGSGNSLG
jgi:myo-inositol-1(or 4)-monophosphatase